MKKKLLTLTFTLVLLIGLVAAMGMNAGAADQALKSYVDVNSWEDLYDFLQQAPGGFTAILTDDIVERNDSYGFEFPTISAAGTIVIDMNGHDIDITSDATEYLFKVGGSSATKLHIVNTKDEGGSIILNSKYTGAHVIQVAQEASEVHLYAGVTLVMGTDGRYFNAHLDKTTAAISAVSFKTIGLHGANIENFMAYGFGINFSGLGNTQYANSNVVIEANSIIRSKNKGLYCFNNTSVSPNVRLAGCTFDYQSSVPTGASEYTPKQNYQAFWFEKMDKDYGSILRFSSFSIQQADAANNSAAWTSVNKTSLLGNTAGKKIKVTPSDCPHTGKQTLINYLADNGGQPSEAHFIVCATCGKYISNDFCTYVQAKPATCTEGAYSAGIDCQCGHKTITKTSDSLGHSYRLVTKRDATCTSVGYYTDVYFCNNCTAKFDANKVQLTPVAFNKLVIQKKGHAYTDANDLVCNNCSAVTAPGTTAKITATQTTNTITLSWDAVPGATGYRIFVAENGKWVQVVKATTATAYTFKNLTAGTKYSYAVRAYIIANGAVTWAEKYATIKTATQPALISKVTSSKQTANSVTLTWNKVSATGYRIFQYNTSTKAWDIVVKATSGTTATITGLKQGTSYIFAVRPYVNTGTQIIWAKTYTKVTTSTMLPAVTLKVASTASGRATIAWGKAAGATGYQVYYSTNASSGYKKIANYTTNSTYQYNLKSGTTYYYRARAYKVVDGAYVYGAWSPVVSVKIK